MKRLKIIILLILTIFLVNITANALTDRIEIAAVQEYMYESVMTEFYVINEFEDDVSIGSILLRIEGDYMIYYGDLVSGVPDFEDEPVTVEKVYNISPGDTWTGYLRDYPMYEVAVGEVQKTVPAGTFTAMEIELYDGENHDTYIGRTWLADGVGYLGYEGEFLGVTVMEELTSYTHVGGDGYWPMAVGNVYVYDYIEIVLEYNAPYMTITVDGDPAEWSSVLPAVYDPGGDDPSEYDGVDIKELYIARDDINLYMMFNFWDGGPTTEWGGSRTGAYQVYVMPDDDESEEIGYISYYGPEPGFWFLSAINFSFDGTMTACGTVMECSIPLANLGNPSSLFRYSLTIGDMDEPYDKSGMVRVNLATTDLDGDLSSNLPDDYLLLQNRPNPFNPNTQIDYSVPRYGQVNIKVYNILGEEVKTLVDRSQNAGNYSINWDGTNSSNIAVASGIYLYRLEADGKSYTKRMLLLK